MTSLIILVGLLLQPFLHLGAEIEAKDSGLSEHVYATVEQNKAFIIVENFEIELASVSVFSPSGLLLYSKPENKLIQEEQLIEISEKGVYWVFYKKNGQSQTLRIVIPTNKNLMQI